MHHLLFLLTLLPALAFALTVSDQVKINEVYFSASPNGTYQDGFIELYNAGSLTAFLDGALLASGVDTFAQLCFRFPGEVGGTSIALFPGAYLLFAADAHDFTMSDPTSVNLSSANFETYSLFESFPGDNADITNLVDYLDIPYDWFLYSLTGQVLLATGESVFIRPCEPGEACGNVVAVIDWHTVVDGVEYLDQIGENSSRLRDEIDAGVILGIEERSGFSAERRTPGEDTDNSRNDFIILEHPTPHTTLSVDHPRPTIPQSATLLSAFPNPFNGETTLRFTLPIASLTEVVGYDILGNKITTIFSGNMTAGEHLLRWDAADNGRALPSGIFLLRLQTNNSTSVIRAIL